MKKRVLSILICLILAVSLLPAAALAETKEITKIEIYVAAPVVGQKISWRQTTFVTAVDSLGNESSLDEGDALRTPQIVWMLNPTSVYESGNYNTWTAVEQGKNDTVLKDNTYRFGFSSTAKSGYTFASNVTVTVNGKAVQGAGKSCRVEVVNGILYVDYVMKAVDNITPDTSEPTADPEPTVAPDIAPQVFAVAEEEPVVDEGADEEAVVEDVEDEEVADEELDETEAEVEETEEEAEVTEDEAPKTGDASTSLWIALALAGAVAAVVAAVAMKKRENA